MFGRVVLPSPREALFLLIFFCARDIRFPQNVFGETCTCLTALLYVSALFLQILFNANGSTLLSSTVHRFPFSVFAALVLYPMTAGTFQVSSKCQHLCERCVSAKNGCDSVLALLEEVCNISGNDGKPLIAWCS